MKNISMIIFALAFIGCEKTVDLDYKGNRSRIIIEGNVTNEPGPYFVRITKSITLKDTGAYPVIDDAIVTISDEAGNRETLAPRGNGLYRTAALQGVEGRTYTLTVEAEGHTYTAQSTLPQQVPFDSLKVEQVLVTGEMEYHVIPVYKDPVVKGNHYRFLLSINNKLLNQHFIQNDELRNGGVNTDRLEISDDDWKLKPGDVVEVSMECVDKNVALFYKTLALMGDSGPGGGTTPNNPPGNISNGALGIFSAHTVETRTVTIP